MTQYLKNTFKNKGKLPLNGNSALCLFGRRLPFNPIPCNACLPVDNKVIQKQLEYTSSVESHTKHTHSQGLMWPWGEHRGGVTNIQRECLDKSLEGKRNR